jgi:hypothetical protein
VRTLALGGASCRLPPIGTFCRRGMHVVGATCRNAKAPNEVRDELRAIRWEQAERVTGRVKHHAHILLWLVVSEASAAIERP